MAQSTQLQTRLPSSIASEALGFILGKLLPLNIKKLYIEATFPIANAEKKYERDANNNMLHGLGEFIEWINGEPICVKLEWHISGCYAELCEVILKLERGIAEKCRPSVLAEELKRIVKVRT